MSDDLGAFLFILACFMVIYLIISFFQGFSLLLFIFILAINIAVVLGRKLSRHMSRVGPLTAHPRAWSILGAITAISYIGATEWSFHFPPPATSVFATPVFTVFTVLLTVGIQLVASAVSGQLWHGFKRSSGFIYMGLMVSVFLPDWVYGSTHRLLYPFMVAIFGEFCDFAINPTFSDDSGKEKHGDAATEYKEQDTKTPTETV